MLEPDAEESRHGAAFPSAFFVAHSAFDRPQLSSRTMSALKLDTPLQYVRGVGPRRAESLGKLGLKTVGDLLDYAPMRYEEALGEVEIADLRPGVTATIRGEVVRCKSVYPGFVATVVDGSGHTCNLRWFQERRGGHGLYVGAQVFATGPVQEYNDRLELVQPTLTIFPPDAPLPKDSNARRGPQPVYPATASLPSPAIERVVAAVFAAGLPEIVDPLPPAVIEAAKLIPREAAVRGLHRPASMEEADAAKRRMAFEELFLLELALALRRQKHREKERGAVLHTTPEIDARIRKRFPFPLTPAQEQAVREVAADMASGRPMTRLLQGDVGSGKTVVALYAALIAVANRRQAAIMAPTELLAQQHDRNVRQYLSGSRVRTLLLSGALTRTQRSAALDAIATGHVDLVIGTQALLQDAVAFSDLALVVVDEQHKFGVLQRAAIRTKGLQPHYLVMTATPIPRTLSLTVFGDLDVSVLSASPPGRGRVTTQIVTPGQGEPLWASLRGRLEAGEQAYVVCPLVGQTPSAPPGDEAGAAKPPSTPAGRSSREKRVPADHQAATILYEKLTAGAWKGLRLGLLHGALPPAEKDRTLQAFASGELQALITTTVVEVGVDVPNATIMAIESAERFGLAQLHQLRGRIGRGGRDGTCYLVVRTRSATAAERLRVLAETTDGFRIAEADLRNRGPGEFLGTRQHGLPELRHSDLIRDVAILEEARAAAFALAARDPELRAREHAQLRGALRRLWADKLRLIDAA
jgi:ATP-dependent DNA helicase RecG